LKLAAVLLAIVTPPHVKEFVLVHPEPAYLKPVKGHARDPIVVRLAQENARTAPHAVPTARLHARPRAPVMQNAVQHVQQNAAAIILHVWIPAKPHAMQNPHALIHVEIRLLVHPRVLIPVKGLV
jgi:hypothetical protein